MIARPQEPKAKIIYGIEIDGDTIRLISPVKDYDVISIVHSLNFKWVDGFWTRVITEMNGDINDRAAELGYKLLSNGFIVKFPNEYIFRISTEQTYKPEHKKWILVGRGEFKGWFRLFWKYSKEDFWNKARMFLSNNQYDRYTQCLCVPSNHYDEVEDFAIVHGFQFSTKAKELLLTSKKAYSEIIIVDTKKKPKESKNEIVLSDNSEGVNNFLDTNYLPFTLKTKTKLYDYQIESVNKLLPLTIGGLLMEMGLGKTRAAIEIVCKRQHRISKVVWFCPVTLKETVYTEIRKHTNTPVDQIVKFDDKTEIENIESVTWYIVGIESMSSSDRVVLTANHIIDKDTFVILDESSYIKGHNSIRANRITNIASKAKYRLILTGTLLSQGVVDLYSQIKFLSPNILGYKSFYSFARSHLDYSEEYKGMITGERDTKKLADKIEPFVYQATKDECLNLPPKIYDTHYFSMTIEQREIYEQAKWDLLLSLDVDDVDSIVIFRLFTALQQIVSGFLNKDGQTIEFAHHRINTLLSIIDRINKSEKIIIWCKYRHSVKAIADSLPCSSLLYGDLSENERNNQIELFRHDNRFLIATQATGGHGLTLNEASTVIFYENEFKYSNRLQAEDRCHRIGQEKKVTYLDVSCLDSIDNRIALALSKKSDLVKSFKSHIDSTKNKRRLLKSL